MQTLVINIREQALVRLFSLLGIAETRPSLNNWTTATLMKKRLTISSLTTMPQTFRVYGDHCPDYEQWLCDRLNKTVIRTIYHPGKYKLTDLEDKARLLMSKNDARNLKDIYDTFRQNCLSSLDYVKRHYGVETRQQWLLDNLQLPDFCFSDCSIKRLGSNGNLLVNLSVDTELNLSEWHSNVKKWLTYNDIKCSTILRTS